MSPFLSCLLQSPYLPLDCSACRLSSTKQARVDFAIQGAATLLQGCESQLHASSSALASHLSSALPLPIRHKQRSQQGSQQGSKPFITSQAHATLCDSAHLVIRLAREAQAADQQHGYSSKAPAWKEALDALQAAAAQSTSIGTEAGNNRDVDEQQQQQQQQHVGESGESSEAEQKLRQQWQTEVESLVKNVLVWAQTIQGKEQEGSQEAGLGSTQQAHGVTLPQQAPYLLCWGTRGFADQTNMHFTS